MLSSSPSGAALRRRLILLVAAVAGAMATTVLVGWAAGVRWLVQPVPLFPAVRPPSALALLLVSLGCAALAVGRLASLRTIAIVVGVLGALEIASTVMGTTNPYERLMTDVAGAMGLRWSGDTSMLPAFASPALAWALLVLSRRATSSRSLLGVVGVGLSLIAVAVGVALVNAAALSVSEAGTLLRGSVHGLVAGLLFGVALLVAVADRQEIPRVPPAGSPELAGLVALGLSILFAISLARREEDMIDQRAALAARAAQREARVLLDTFEDELRARGATAPGATAPGESAPGATAPGATASRAVLAPLFQDSTTGFRVVAWSDALAGAVRGVASFTVPLGGDTMRLAVRPTGKQARSFSVLPTVILIFGSCVAVLLVLVLRMVRGSWFRARELEMARVQHAIDSGSDGVWEYDFAGGRARRSPTQLRHLGFDPDWFNAQAGLWESRLHPDDAERTLAQIALARRDTEDLPNLQYRVQAADGRWHTIVDRGRVVERLPDGSAKVMIGISADVTERVRADAQREASERRFRAMFNSALHGQILLDLEACCEEVNGTALQIVGAERAEVVGIRLMDGPWFTGLQATRGVLEEQFQRAAAGHATHFEVDAHLLDGRLGLLECSFTPLLGADGAIAQVLLELRDVTERRRAEGALREIGAITAMGRMAARVAHEINNPLAGIQNSYLLLADAVPETHPHHRFVAAMEREIQRIASITRQLYETYRLDEAHSTESSLVIAVNDAVSFLDQVNRGRGIRIRTDLSRAPSRVPFPDALLRQLLYNLMQNAVEASPIGGTVWVRARQEGNGCVVTVSDEGIGIAPELRERIFDPFFSTKDPRLKTSGMGLGLALVKQSVSAVGGTITLLEQEGPGSTFEVRIPMASVATAAQL